MLPNKRNGWAVLFLALTYAALTVYCMDRWVGAYDEGVILTGAERFGAGDVIHRDFYAVYGIGNFAILSLLFDLFSHSVMVLRCFDTLIRAAIVALTFVLIRGAGSALAAWIGSGYIAAWLLAYGTYGYPVFPVLALALGSLLCLVPVFAGSQSSARLRCAGLLAGGVGLFRYDSGLYVFASELVVLSVYSWTAGGKARVKSTIAPYCIGLLLVAAPIGLVLVGTGALSDLLQQVILDPARTYGTMRGLPIDWFSVGAILPIIGTASVALAVAAVFAKRGPHSSADYLLAVLLLLSVAFSVKGFVRFSPIQMSAAMVTSVVALGVMAGAPRFQTGALRLLVLASVLAYSTGIVSPISSSLARALENLAVTDGDGRCSHRAEPDRLGCFRTNDERMSAVRYIVAATKPGTPLFVGLGRHDKVVVNDALFYFLADRPSATKWHHMDPGVNTTEAVQRAIIAELQASRPPYIVLETQWDDVREPNGSAVSSGVELLDRYIPSAYTRVQSYGTFQILRQTASIDPAP